MKVNAQRYTIVIIITLNFMKVYTQIYIITLNSMKVHIQINNPHKR